ncbi:hypothetical protein DAPPUDRAFT_99285 [Daphnia pulex]|uniref:Uncharacterized protein n=1 Tax=Daphnia pulex TaxID=6669 RepID=E9G693_DAPPU|nr:hypothetical protein DAPPUDRAFT_99285 [Daphnia pulex]|eukprot:EFX84894.1 hypothetical protein DAPPUDRAFT_99285 [Daphnia pulex]
MIATDCWCWAQEEPELEQAVVARPAVDELESMMEEAAAAAAEDLRWHHRIPSNPRRKTYDVDNIRRGRYYYEKSAIRIVAKTKVCRPNKTERTVGRLANPVMSAPARLTLAPTSDLFVLGTGAAIERRSREEGENKVQTHTLLDRQTCCLSGLLLRISAIGRSILLTKPTAAPAAPAACGFERKREISRLYGCTYIRSERTTTTTPATPIAITSLPPTLFFELFYFLAKRVHLASTAST